MVSLDGIEAVSQPEQVILLLNLQNRSDQMLPVSGLRYRLDLDDVEFAWGTSRQYVEVPARGEAIFEVVVPGRMPEMTAGQTKLNYSLSGMVQLVGERRPIAFSRDGSLNWQAARRP